MRHPPPPKGFVEPKCRSRGLPLGLGQVEFGRMARQVLSGGMLGANIGRKLFSLMLTMPQHQAADLATPPWEPAQELSRALW